MATVNFTLKAAQRVAHLRQERGDETLMLRLCVDGGGCSGFQYRFDFDTQSHADDQVFTTDGVCLLIDKTSLSLLDGSEIDYVTTLAGSAFAVKNPQAASTCGCGTSFSIG